MKHKITTILKISAAVFLIGLSGATAYNGARGAPDKPADTNFAKTQYPIVLVHGLFGFGTMPGVDYWHGIVDDLRAHGATVYVANVQAANTAQVRGEQLLAYLENIQKTDHHARFNLFGHSYGGPTIRYATALRPDLIASATSVGGVNQGTELAANTIALSNNDPVKAKVFYTLTTGLSVVVDALSGQQTPLNQDVKAAISELTPTGMAQFNRQFPAGLPHGQCYDAARDANRHSHIFKDGSKVDFYSWTGTAQVTSWRDPSSLVVAVTSHYMNGTDHDGFVPRCSAHLGKVLGDDYALNHLNEVNQFFGLLDKKSPDPVALFRNQAHLLQSTGL